VKTLRKFGIILIATHLLAAVWHLFVLTKILPTLENQLNRYAIGLAALFARRRLCSVVEAAQQIRRLDVLDFSSSQLLLLAPTSIS
jgi:hypothetical protein